MTAAAEAVVADQEWWERLRDRCDAWRRTHPGPVRAVAGVRAVLLWVGLVWIAVVLVWMPDLGLGARAWLGCLWLVVVWFLLLRTKTLTASGYGRWFALSVLWSVPTGVISALLSAGAGGVAADGPGIGIAAFTEEATRSPAGQDVPTSSWCGTSSPTRSSPRSRAAAAPPCARCSSATTTSTPSG